MIWVGQVRLSIVSKCVVQGCVAKGPSGDFMKDYRAFSA